MIYGVGTDQVSIISRIENVLRCFGARFVHRILYKTEMADYAQATQPAYFLAKRFAAKETFSKALGTGIGEKMRWHNIWLSHDGSGRPTIGPSLSLAQHLAIRHIDASHISLSDESGYALAFVILERK